ncbi:MAG: hypothetical protein V7709_11720 [Halioglobus sp.]
MRARTIMLIGARKLCAPVLLTLLSCAAMAVSQSEVDGLNAQCEAARAESLAPIRAQRVQSCIEQKIRQPDHCERYYSTYGNTTVQGSRRIGGMFYDLPQCQAYLEAREALQASRSR